MLTAERARELLDYAPLTGVFLWKVGRGKIRAGSVAGSLGSNGYWRITIDYVEYLGHRLAWLMTHGAWPDVYIDHESTNKAENQLSNLRAATGTQNQGNRRIGSNNTSGCKGVNWHKGAKKWRAVLGKKHLGHFVNFQDAVAARMSAASEYFGEFARAA